MESGERKRVLVVGGSGYLGQHLLVALSAAEGGGRRPYDLAFTHLRPAPPQDLAAAVSPALAFRVDLQTGEGFDSISVDFGQPHVVVNCAAISVPRACEEDPEAAMATNLPSSLVNWMSGFRDSGPLLIHLSTDQVYEGVQPFYKEEDEPVPVNMYGKSKVAAEKFISLKCSNFAILRSSIIYGPQTVSPVSKSLPIQKLKISLFSIHRGRPLSQSKVAPLRSGRPGFVTETASLVEWIDSVLSRGQQVDFFHDEFRCPVYVKDVVNIILALIKKWISGTKQIQLLLNIGGPDRLSRMQMAESVATFRGYDRSLIKPVSASAVNRGVASPADISMDISRLIQVLGITPISFEDGVRLTLENDGVSW